MECPTCEGRGTFPYSTDICPVCKGKTKLDDSRIDHDDCRICKGKGKFPYSTDVCPVCSGWGKLPDPPENRGPISVVLVESGTPRTAHLQVADILEDLRGEVRVCDPFYGAGSLLRLDLLRGCSRVMFLTKDPDGAEREFADRALTEFVRERRQFEVRRCSTRQLHDRYVLTDDDIIILGHGLKDIGNKQSFIIRLNRSACGDVLDSVRSTFDSAWATAESITR